jgi:peroxiredoxin
VQLGELHKVEQEIQDLGYRLVAVSPIRPEKIKGLVSEHELGFTLLSDSPMDAAQAFGIAWRMPDDMVETYRGYGVDLTESNGHDHQLLPVPSVFLVDPEGMIHFTYVNPNHRIRLSSEVLLAAARALGASLEEEE